MAKTTKTKTLKQKNSHIQYHNVEQGSAEWLRLRENQFTGSNAYKLLTSFGAGSWAKSTPSEFKGNFYTKRGHLLEDRAIELYERIRDCKVDHTGFVTNSKIKGCLYSPDGFRPDRTIEVKCFKPENHLEAIKYQSLSIKAQVYFGQLIMEKPLTDLILYCPKPKEWDEKKQGVWPVPVDKMLVIITIERDPAIERNFKRIIKAYYDN